MDDAPSDGEPIAARYSLSRVIGSGATAVVHEGRDLITGQPVAVKLYRASGTVRHRVQQQREIAALTRLRHPGLIALHDCGTEPGHDGRTYLVTDLVEGPSLRTRLFDGPLSTRSVYELTARLATALAYVHAHGFLHRDIKPANILLAHGHEPLLADFGIARALDGTIATATGAVSGTAAYLAPEQVRGGPVEPAADVYALGLVLLEALTGRLEYPGTVVESAIARLHRRPVIPPGLPWNLTTLLEAMTDPDPAERPTAAAIALATADPPDTTSADLPAPTPVPVERPSRDRPRRKAPVLAVAGLLLAVLLGGVSLLITTAHSNIANTPAIGVAPAASAGEAREVGGGATTEPVATPSTRAVPQPAAPAVAEEPANPQPVAAYTRLQTGDTDAQSSPAGPAHVAAEPDAATAEDTEGNANDEKGSGKANGNGKDKGNGKDNGDGGGKGNGKKDD
ncbi:MAG: eukaryotic-like serine/threonine-protein kinase [Pseudonocardiales bacterium]|nr:eukaryotic-like serine/threonine-protein kinase [Pseudonocardiales bacterium]